MLNKIKQGLKYGLIIILAGVIFFGGFYVGEYKVQSNFVTPAEQKSLLGNADFGIFWNVWATLREKYLKSSTLDSQKAVYGAISGLVNSVGDPYTVFLPPEQARNFAQDLSGSFGGIGIEIGIRRGILTVVAPLEDTPAKTAGLKAGDQIIKINGRDTYNMALDEAVSRIRGQIGTQVILTIARDEFNQPKDFAITRATIVVKMANSKMINQEIGYIKLNSFGQTSYFEFINSLLNLYNQNPRPKAYILDLRDDPGGYLDMAVNIAGVLLKRNSLVVSEDFGNKIPSQEHYAQGNELLADLPLVVLANKGTASAAEILAGALRDDRGIKLVGEQTFGKGSVQEGIELPDDSVLKVTIAQWLTPRGKVIQDKGLKPDIPVVNADPKVDAQLNKAIQVLENQLASQ